jgi:hypothetical protein
MLTLCIFLRDLKKWEIEEDNRLESLYRDRLEDETQQLKKEINKKIEMIKVKLKENLETTKLKIRYQLEKEREVKLMETAALYLYVMSVLLTLQLISSLPGYRIDKFVRS